MQGDEIIVAFLKGHSDGHEDNRWERSQSRCEGTMAKWTHLELFKTFMTDINLICRK